MKAFMIAPTAIIKGIGMHLDFDIYDVEGATGYYDSNYYNKLNYAETLLKQDDYDFGFVHIKAVDDAGHDKNANLKVLSITYLYFSSKCLRNLMMQLES